jgi:hypothetical protein
MSAAMGAMPMTGCPLTKSETMILVPINPSPTTPISMVEELLLFFNVLLSIDLDYLKINK